MEGLTTPELALGEGLQRDGCDNSVIIGASSKRFPEIGIRRSICIYDIAASEDDLKELVYFSREKYWDTVPYFKILDHIARKAKAGREVGNAACMASHQYPKQCTA